jgi:hypothetical protein
MAVDVTPLPAERITGGVVLEAEHACGLLRFEELNAGDWLTLKGEPARKGRRNYFLNGECLPFSVSGIVETLSKPALYTWHEDRGVRGGVQAERMGELVDVPPEDWAHRVRSLDLGADAERDQASDRGHAIHEVFHTLARTGEAPDMTTIPPEWLPWYRGALRAWLALNPTVIEAEFLVCHPDLRYAGRPDLYAITGGVPTLIDYKTSAKGRIWSEAHYQTRGYAEAMPFGGLPYPERIVIVAVNNDGGYLLEDCAVEPAEWDALVTVAHSRRDVEARRSAHRKAQAEALKAAA